MKNISRFGIGAVLVIGLLATASMVSAVTSVSKCSQIGATKVVKNVSFRCVTTPQGKVWQEVKNKSTAVTTKTTISAGTQSVPINGYLVGPGANLQNANLQGANLAGLNLSSANLIGANLISANLQGSNLSSANLYGANLGSANLRSANLRNANFTSAELNRVDMRGADIAGTVFTNASYYLTILSDGSTR
jgi:hypothetical protein